MYSLSYHHRQEFLIIPELVRTTMTLCASGLEPTVLIKTLSLSLKFLVRSPAEPVNDFETLAIAIY